MDSSGRLPGHDTSYALNVGQGHLGLFEKRGFRWGGIGDLQV